MAEQSKPTQAETVAPATGAAAVEKTTAAAPTDTAAAPAPAAAPVDLFAAAPAAGSSNPERIRVVAAQLADYAKNMASAQAEKATMRKGVASMVAAIRSALISSGADLNKILDLFVDAIKKDESGAFAETRIFSQMDCVPGADRDAYVKFLGTMVTYAKLNDKQRIHDQTNLAYIGEIFTVDINRKAFIAYFPKK